MKRIGIDVTSALTQGGGIGRYTRELLYALADLNHHETQSLHFFSAKPPDPPPVTNPLPQHGRITYTPSPLTEQWLYRVWYRFRLPIPVQWTTGKLDLFHSPDFVLPPVSGNIPTLLTVHDLSFAHYPEVYTPALVNYLNKVVPWSVSRATHILADSQATKDDLVDLWSVAPEKISVLYSGVNGRFRSYSTVELDETAVVRERYKLGDRPYIFSVGTIQPRKNYRMLIRAFAQIADRVPHNLVIAGGKGWLYDDILQEVVTHQLEDRVIFAGFVADEDLPTLYNHAAVYAFPSLYEGFGLPMLEAMASGVPVINSNTSCLPEVAGEATVQLSPDDEAGWAAAFVSLFEDKDQQAMMRTAGFDQSEKFTWSRSAQQLLTIYDKLLSN